MIIIKRGQITTKVKFVNLTCIEYSERKHACSWHVLPCPSAELDQLKLFFFRGGSAGREKPLLAAVAHIQISLN